MKRFLGKTVVVTGSGRGIGAQTVRRFSSEGAQVVVADIDFGAAEHLASSVANSLPLEVDVRSPESLDEMIHSTTERFGGIDVFINNAMTCGETPFLEVTPAEVRRDLEVNLFGPFLASQRVIPGMIKRGGGVILNVTSVNGLAFFGNEAYSAAKAGLISLTRSIAVQFGQNGIRCNAVAPGTVATEHWEARRELDPNVFEKASEWYPIGRIGNPDDIADSLMFLASDEASWITGIVLPVEGGILAGNLQMARTIMPSQRNQIG